MIDILRYANIFNDFADRESRRTTLEFILEAEGIPFEKMVSGRATNIVVNLSADKEVLPQYAVGAHFDKVSNSKGINDNAVAVATLIKIAKEYKNKDIPMHVVFFDKEESGMIGSSGYGKANKQLKHVLVLDIIGFGDTPVICTADGICDFPTTIGISDDLPSDNYGIRGSGVDTSLIVTVPRADLELKDGKVKLTKSPSFYSSFHGKEFDDIKYINWSAVKKIYNDVVAYIESRQFTELTYKSDVVEEEEEVLLLTEPKTSNIKTDYSVDIEVGNGSTYSYVVRDPQDELVKDKTGKVMKFASYTKAADFADELTDKAAGIVAEIPSDEEFPIVEAIDENGETYYFVYNLKGEPHLDERGNIKRFKDYEEAEEFLSILWN